MTQKVAHISLLLLSSMVFRGMVAVSEDADSSPSSLLADSKAESTPGPCTTPVCSPTAVAGPGGLPSLLLRSSYGVTSRHSASRASADGGKENTEARLSAAAAKLQRFVQQLADLQRAYREDWYHESDSAVPDPPTGAEEIRCHEEVWKALFKGLGCDVPNDTGVD